MGAALDVDKEAVKMLAIEIGLRPAARKMGLDENTVRQWSARGKWFAPVTLPVTMQKQDVTNVTNSPSAVLQAELTERKHETRLNLAKYAVEASGKAARSKGNLAIAGQVRHVAAILPSVWPEEQGPIISVQLLNGTGSME